MSRGVGRRCCLDLAWLCCRPAAAAPVPSLTQKLAYVTSAVQKKKKKKKKTNTLLAELVECGHYLDQGSRKWACPNVQHE